MAFTANEQTVVDLFIAAYGRAPAQTGLDFFVGALEAGTMTEASIKDYMFDTANNSEAATRFPVGTTAEASVETVFQNVLGRSTATAEGLAFWAAKFDDPEYTMSDLVAEVIAIAKDPANADDAAVLVAKSAAVEYFLDTVPAADQAGAQLDTDTVVDTATLNAAKQEVNDLAAEAGAQTYAVSAASTGVTEGSALNFTVTLGLAVSAETVLNYQIQGVAVAGGTATPVADLGVLNGTVTVPAGATTGTFTITPTNDQVTEGYEGFKVALLDSSFATIASSQNVAISDAPNSGQTFTLTTGVDGAPAFTGGAGNDIYTGTNLTLTALDSLDGGAGDDVLNINDIAGTNFSTVGFTVANIETANLKSATGTVVVDASTWTGLTDLNVTQAGIATMTAATTTDVTVTNTTGAITVDGGKNISVTDAGTNNAIKIGDTTVNAGTISVTDTKVGTAAITIDGGTDVTVTATGSTATGTIGIGQGAAATDLPSGAVVVTSTSAAAVDNAANVTMHAVNVDGGSTVSITQSVNKGTMATTGVNGATIIQGAVSVDAGNTTTAVTVVQEKTVAEILAVAAVAAVAGTRVITFTDVTVSTAITVGGLTFTTTGAATAEEQAAAFANLTAGATQGCSAKGVYTGSFSTAFTGGATVTTTGATTATLAFTEVTASTGTAALAVTNAATALGVTGVAAVTAVTGVTGVTSGVVAVDDNATKSVTTITLDGYGAATLGADVGTGSLNSLQTLSLANSAATATLTTTVTSLNLTLNNVTGIVDDSAGTIKTLNITTATKDSATALDAAGVETLTVSGTNAVNLTGATLTALKTVTVSGSAGLTIAANGASVTAVNTSATTGTVTATLDADLATYTGGAGNDIVNVTAASTNVVKAIDLGNGDNTLTLGAITLTTGTIAAGTGTDTISMTVAAADTADGSATFAGKVTGFERLSLTGATAAADTVNVAALGNYNYVTIDGQIDDAGNADEVTTISGLGANSTVVVTGVIGLAADDDTLVLTLTDATAGSDVLNLGVSAAGVLATGEVVVASVETINITTTDTTADVVAGTNAQSLTLKATSATAITVTGNSDFTLDTATNTAVTSINASTMTGKLNVTAAGTVATTITGGAGADSLAAATGATTADVLIGGAGNDTLTANSGLNTLTGGTGNDKFVIGVASLNSSSYATITDFAAGDSIKFTGADSFAASKVTQADTAVFQDYANAAINAVGQNDVAWFQYLGNTYIVMDAGADTTTFTNSQDFVVRLTGLVDLTNASFNNDSDTIQICG